VIKGIGMAMVLAAVAGVASAQNPPPAPQDSGPYRAPMMQGPQGPMSPEELRMRVEQRWDQRVQTELGLSDQLMDRLRTAERANQDRHRDLNRREEDLHRAVMAQLQPGVAANAATLSDALDQLAAIRVQHAQSDQQLLRDLAFLSPVQRARYFIMARRFQEMLDQVRRNRMPAMAPGGMQPGMRPMQRRPLMQRRGPGMLEEQLL
jgi:hypothetical protein